MNVKETVIYIEAFIVLLSWVTIYIMVQQRLPSFDSKCLDLLNKLILVLSDFMLVHSL